MKKLIISLFTVFMAATVHQGYAQNTPQEAIAILRVSGFIDILRNPTDTLANVDRFIGELNKIFPVDQQKHSLLKERILSVLRKKEGFSEDRSLIYWPLGQYPFVGSNIDRVLKDNFSISVCEKLSGQLAKNLKVTITAYEYLVKRHKINENLAALGFIDTPDYINMIYEYFDI
jgi:hypothetical protein